MVKSIKMSKKERDLWNIIWENPKEVYIWIHVEKEVYIWIHVEKLSIVEIIRDSISMVISLTNPNTIRIVTLHLVGPQQYFPTLLYM